MRIRTLHMIPAFFVYTIAGVACFVSAFSTPGVILSLALAVGGGCCLSTAIDLFRDIHAHWRAQDGHTRLTAFPRLTRRREAKRRMERHLFLADVLQTPGALSVCHDTMQGLGLDITPAELALARDVRVGQHQRAARRIQELLEKGRSA